MIRRAVTISILTIAAWSAVDGKERLVRRFDHRDGLPVSFVSQVAQDRDGFLWIATQGGLVRYDGVEMRAWGREVTIGSIDRVWTGPGGEVLVREHPSGELFRVEGDSLAAVAGGDGTPLRDVEDAAFDAAGDLLVVGGEALLRRDRETGWVRVGPGLFDGETPRRFGPWLESRPLVVTSGGVWTLDENGGVERLLAQERVADVQPHPSGSLFVVHSSFPTSLFELREGNRIEHLSLHDGPVDLALRGETVWFAHRLGLVALRPGKAPERLDVENCGRTGGFLHVDREGSLWMANLHGLFQFPEPETTVWTTNDGLPVDGTRFLERAAEGLWVTTWGGLALLEDEAASWIPYAAPPRRVVRSMLCADAWDRFWTGVALDEGPARREGLLQRTAGRFVIDDGLDKVGVRCAPASDGTVWLSREERVLRTVADGGRPREVSRLPESLRIDTLFEDPAGTLWVGGTGTICHAAVNALAHGPAWSCERLPEEHQVRSLVATPSGTVWAATSGGLFRRVGERWETIPASRTLPSEWILNLRPSPSGGTWIAGSGTLLRVEERPGDEAGWKVVESPGVWQGIPSSGAADVLEDPDGTLWLATSSGVVQVPPAARRTRASAPEVRLTAATVDGRPFPAGDPVRLPYRRNRVELSFAALSYRDPSRIRYRVRPRPDAPWSESRISGFRFVDLRPGHYEPEVVASLDGVRWSDSPARLAFTVLAPWYRRPWALVLFGALLAGGLLLAYRLRVAMLLRLERQRTRIAMDLHDEMGAGLGSIGLLADLVADRSIGESERADLASRISTTARELGGSLTDIIWSLRSRSEKLEMLGAYLQERARVLIPDRSIRIATDFPAPWPDVRLSLGMRRNLQRIAVEALRNVVRHARAARVEIGLRRSGSREWVLWIEDDGRGMPAEPAPGEGSGLGLKSLRERAGRIGARIAWTGGSAGGTRVEVTFDPSRRSTA